MMFKKPFGTLKSQVSNHKKQKEVTWLYYWNASGKILSILKKPSRLLKPQVSKHKKQKDVTWLYN